MGEAVLRLHGGVREEGIGVRALDNFYCGLQSFVCVAVAADSDGGRLLRKFIGTAGEASAALLGGCAFDPFGLQLLARSVGLPPGISDDGDAAMQAEQIGSSIYRKS